MTGVIALAVVSSVVFFDRAMDAVFDDFWAHTHDTAANAIAMNISSPGDLTRQISDMVLLRPCFLPTPWLTKNLVLMPFSLPLSRS